LQVLAIYLLSLLYPDSYKIGQIEPVLAATAAASNYAMKTV
jgi:hypothetical protein